MTKVGGKKIHASHRELNFQTGSFRVWSIRNFCAESSHSECPYLWKSQAVNNIIFRAAFD